MWVGGGGWDNAPVFIYCRCISRLFLWVRYGGDGMGWDGVGDEIRGRVRMEGVSESGGVDMVGMT